MAYTGFITEIKELRPHPNADRLQIATFYDNDTCVSIDAKIGDRGVYFPSGGQLSKEYCENNNLCRKKDENGNNIGGYLDPDKRNITAIKLRGEKSDGIFMSLESLAFTGVNLDELTNGTLIDVVNGIEICKKYIPRSTGRPSAGPAMKKAKTNIAPLFFEHVETEQLAYNLSMFKPNDLVEITLKMHGTSQRTGFLPVLKGHKKTIWERITRKQGTPIYEYDYVTGTRRTVLNTFEGGYYGNDAFREKHENELRSKLYKGETVYYEVVGYVTEDIPIMASCNNKKTNDKEFIKKYGDFTEFSYGCKPGESHMYVYRMTMTNEQGHVVEYSPSYMRYRCRQMDVDCVPVLWRGFIPDEEYLSVNSLTAGEWIKNKAEEYYDGPDPVGETHVREGVVIRRIEAPSFTAFKHKNFSFKVLSGIAIAQAEADGALDNMSEDMISEL